MSIATGAETEAYLKLGQDILDLSLASARQFFDIEKYPEPEVRDLGGFSLAVEALVCVLQARGVRLTPRIIGVFAEQIGGCIAAQDGNPEGAKLLIAALQEGVQEGIDRYREVMTPVGTA